MKKNRFSVTCLLLVSPALYSVNTNGQTGDSLLRDATLQNIIQFAVKNQPAVQQSEIDEKITELQIKSKLADWYPQVNFNYLYQHNFQVQTSIIGGIPLNLVLITLLHYSLQLPRLFLTGMFYWPTGQKAMFAYGQSNKQQAQKSMWQ